MELVSTASTDNIVILVHVGKERLAEMLHISADSAKNLMSSFLGA